ncbi:MAG: type II toxin-antitoxin system RelE/ParE family toxin [Flavobacteriales bacterium]|uniref:type II toxin-antitoxin system RelE/ParE family toxin n=1 Tax=Sanyastnella coralliicola TaxID=3069118 RepID=UPI0027B9E786|nr:type II toxin-antitoxin system RelE/ParE family toxin [Longitalea sp. SCSIO 12813]MCH2200001.1 type II toxin-antitoxin system RelE/ParE family toxin [Flavobacteriales bacterium]
MSQYKVLVSERAEEAFRTLIEKVASTSLIGAEDARMAVMNRMRKLGSNPIHQSRKAKFSSLNGDYRSILAWNYRIYYKVEDKRVVILDLFLDKG